MTNLGDPSSFEETGVAQQVAEQVFANEVKTLTDRLKAQEQLSMNIIIGIIVVCIISMIALVWDSRMVLRNTNDTFIEAHKSFTNELKEIRKENATFRESILTQSPYKY